MAKTEAAAGTDKKAEGGKKVSRKTFKKRGEKRVVHHGFAHIQASFNNTVVTITDAEGNVIAWSSAGGIGFKGSRKGTPFAATQAAMAAGTAAKTYGMRSLEVRVKGPGAGRESAVRALQTVGLDVGEPVVHHALLAALLERLLLLRRRFAAFGCARAVCRFFFSHSLISQRSPDRQAPLA